MMALFRESLAAGCLFLACAATAARAGSYTVQIDVPFSASHIVAVDEDTSGNFHMSWPYSVTGPGLTTLTNANPSPSLKEFFLIGTYHSDTDNLDHIFLTMNPKTVDSVTGLFFSTAFNGYHEIPTVQAVKDITSGPAVGNPTVDGGMSYLSGFASTNHDLLFTGFNEPVVAVYLTAVTPIGSTAPLPSAAYSGLAMFGMIAGVGLLKRKMGRKFA